MKTLIERIVEDEQSVAFVAGDSFLLAYPEFLRYFQDLVHIERHHLVIAANFTYGWMPTMLRFKTEDIETAADVLNRAKSEEMISNQDILCLTHLVNNSLVGASKLLHFVNPRRYSIWDSRVYRYLHGGFSLYQLQRLRNYLAYLEVCRETIAHPTFGSVNASINRKVGYAVTPMRAVELVMFMSSARQGIPEMEAV